MGTIILDDPESLLKRERPSIKSERKSDVKNEVENFGYRYHDQLLEAIVEYLLQNQMDISQLKESPAQVKKILPYLHVISPVWSSVSSEKFDESKYV